MERRYDLVLYGATGFTGRQAVAYLAKAAPPGLRWAIAGRDRARLEALAPPGVDVLVADAADPVAVDAMVSATRVVMSTAGPFQRYGDPIVAACVAHKTHWCDITGETPWGRGLVDRFHEQAVADGTRIVSFCGFDSVPSDLGAWMVARWIRDTWDQPTASISGAFSFKGGLNGGTLASALDLSDLRGIGDPALLSPPAWRTAEERARAPSDFPAVAWSADLGRFVGPFFMSSTNTRVVRRSRALLADAGFDYGPGFTYGEAMESRSRWGLYAMSAGLVGGFALLRTGVGRAIAKQLGPKPGEGPTEAQMDGGFFRARLIGVAGDGRKAMGVVEAQGDPGNRGTVKMLAEAALALATDTLPSGGGVLTPASAFGQVLIDRLRAAGMTWTVAPLAASDTSAPGWSP